MEKTLKYRNGQFSRKDNRIGWREYYVIGFCVLMALVLIPNYLEGEYLMERKIIQYYINENSDSIDSDAIPSRYHDAVVNAYEKWNTTNPEYTFVQIFEKSNHATEIRFQEDLHKVYGVRDDVLGVAQGHGRIILQFSGNDDCRDLSMTDMERLVLHEIGHTLGINHHSDPDHLMYGKEKEYNYNQSIWNLPTAEKWNCR